MYLNLFHWIAENHLNADKYWKSGRKHHFFCLFFFFLKVQWGRCILDSRSLNDLSYNFAGCFIPNKKLYYIVYLFSCNPCVICYHLIMTYIFYAFYHNYHYNYYKTRKNHFAVFSIHWKKPSHHPSSQSYFFTLLIRTVREGPSEWLHNVYILLNILSF